MNAILPLTAWTLYTFAIHTFVGQRRVAAPLAASPDVPAFARGTLEVVWHACTWNLVLAAAVLAVHAVSPQPALVALVTVQLAGMTLLFLWLGPRRLGSGFALPQWMLLGPLVVAATLLNAPPMLAPASLLVAIAVVHVGWAFGVTWPAPSAHAMAAYVIGWPEGRHAPSRAPTLVVALTLFALAAGLVSGLPGVRWLVVAIFATRGLVGLVETRWRPSIVGTPYALLSRLFYSPLCLFIAALAGAAA